RARPRPSHDRILRERAIHATASNGRALGARPGAVHGPGLRSHADGVDPANRGCRACSKRRARPRRPSRQARPYRGRQQVRIRGLAPPAWRRQALMARDVWVLHGANLGLLGRREPELYGKETLASIDRRLSKLGETLGLRVSSFQTNHEGAFIDRLTVAMDE